MHSHNNRFQLAGLSLCLFAFIGCPLKTKEAPKPSKVFQENVQTANGEPAYVTIQHCLIGMQGSVPGKFITRSQEEADKLAHDLLEKVQSGADFDKIIQEHTDDSPPGIYNMANHGFPGDMSSAVADSQVFERSGMVPGFGNVGFQLEVGEFGIAEFDRETSPYGWHIIKRLK